MTTSPSGQQPSSGPDAVDLPAIIEALKAAGASFAYLHGSQAAGTARVGSDVDVAAWFGRPVDPWVAAAGLPEVLDLLVLDTAPLELAGRVALRGQLLFETDPADRVAWEASTRKVYLDEQPRWNQARRDFVRARQRG